MNNLVSHFQKISALLLVVTLLLVTVACGQNEAKSAAPIFELPDMNGNTITLEELSGEKVYIKFWTSWCSICLSGLEELNELAAMDEDFTVLTIVHPSYQGEKSVEDFITWYESLDFENITVLLDEEGEWTKRFRVMAYPTSYYIGTDQLIEKSTVGHQTNKQIKRTIRGLN